MALQVSIGQATANALARWLVQSLSPDITVIERWPNPDFELPPKAISITRAGKRQRLDLTEMAVVSAKQVGAGPQANVSIQIGSVIQPLQLDVWATSDAERDDILAQLDVVLYAGTNQTLSISGDPVRDGILLPLLDGFEGNNCDFWFDAPEIIDSPTSAQQSEYRAILFGEARTGLVVTPDQTSALLTKPVPILDGGTDPIT